MSLPGVLSLTDGLDAEVNGFTPNCQAAPALSRPPTSKLAPNVRRIGNLAPSEGRSERVEESGGKGTVAADVGEAQPQRVGAAVGAGSAVVGIAVVGGDSAVVGVPCAVDSGPTAGVMGLEVGGRLRPVAKSVLSAVAEAVSATVGTDTLACICWECL